MTAAIYARKSTDQSAVNAEEKSITRQVAHARAYATGKGWMVAEEHVYVDDGISGAEFANRPGFLRLMNALKPQPAFQVLVMSEESRLGREAIETAYALKQLITAGVRVFFYLENRERTLESPTDKLLMSVTAFADELEREKARQRTYDAMVRKARAGHVTGGRVFGYDNVEMTGLDGRRSHVERRINEAEASVVRRIFEFCAAGYGIVRITKTLNEDGALAPRPQQRRPAAWAPSSVREVLYRRLYRGEIVWNQTQKRNHWGQKAPKARQARDWVTVHAPHLRLVTEELWDAAHARLDVARAAYLRGTGGQLWGRPSHGTESKYLLSGLTRCSVCGGSIYVKTRSHGKRRAFFYGCTSYHLRGRVVCGNHLEVPMDMLDDALLSAIEREVLHPDVIEIAVQKSAERLRPSIAELTTERAHLEAQMSGLDRELERLTAAIATGGELAALTDGLREREAAKGVLSRRIALLDAQASFSTMDPATLTTDLRARLDDWRGLLRRQTPQARQILRKLFPEPLKLGPEHEGFVLHGYASVEKIVRGMPSANTVASLRGSVAGWIVEFQGEAA